MTYAFLSALILRQFTLRIRCPVCSVLTTVLPERFNINNVRLAQMDFVSIAELLPFLLEHDR